MIDFFAGLFAKNGYFVPVIHVRYVYLAFNDNIICNEIKYGTLGTET